MNPRTKPLLPLRAAPALALLLLLPAPPATAQEYWECIVIHAVGQVTQESSCDPYYAQGATPMITLTGTMELVTRDLSNLAIVSCWVCEGGSCGNDGLYGPSRWIGSLPLSGDAPVSLAWSVAVLFADAALGDPMVTFPSLASYHCHLELESTSRGVDAFEPTFPPTVPDPFANHLHARTEAGTTPVVVLEGPLLEPVSNVRRAP